MTQPTIRSRTKTKDVQIAEIGINTQVLRSRSWGRLRLEVEYALAKGTTSNSYLIKGDKIALIDPPGQSFTQIYLEILSNHPWRKIDYIILQHVNSNRLATIKLLAGYIPQAKIICSQPVADALKGALIFPAWKSRVVVVKDKDTLDLGRGHKLEFIGAATPRWLDGLCTYDPQSQILFTDKLFGQHVCNESIFDRDAKNSNSARRFYFDCLYASQTKQLETILAKIRHLNPKIYAPAHGSSIEHNRYRVGNDYSSWCRAQNYQQSKVVLLYAAGYNKTIKIADAIAYGLVQSGTAVELINCESTSTAEIIRTVRASDGFAIGLPTFNGQISQQIQTTLEIILTNTAKNKLVGLFGSNVRGGQALSAVESKLRDSGYNFGFEPFCVNFSLDRVSLEECIRAGKEFSQKLKKSQQLRIVRSTATKNQINRVERAV